MGINEKAWHVGFKWTIGNEDVPAGALALDNTSKQLHICDIADTGKDWNVGVVVDPTVYIHCFDTNAAADYIKIWHDDTDATIDCYGATALNLGFAGTNRIEITSGGAMNIGYGSALSYDAGTPLFTLYATSSNATSTNAEPFYVYSAMTGATGYGGRSRFHTYTNVALQTNFMALKAHAEFGVNGRIGGTAAGFCSELVMPNAATGSSGAYYVLELEYVAGGNSLVTQGSLGGNHAAFILMNNSGDAAGDFDTNGYLAKISGLTTGAGNLFATGTLRIGVGTTAYYLPLSTAAATFTSAYPVVLTHASTPLAITSTMASTTGQDLCTFTVTDSSVLASDYNRAIYINWTTTGSKTGGYINPISIDFNAITDVCDSEVALECLYIAQTGDKFTSNVFAWQVYCEDLGTGVGNVEMLDMGRVMTNSATTGRDGFIRAKGHGGTCASILYCEGTSDALATQFITLCGCSGAAQLFQHNDTTLQSSHSITGRLRVALEGTPGTVDTQYYIALYTAD